MNEFDIEIAVGAERVALRTSGDLPDDGILEIKINGRPQKPLRVRDGNMEGVDDYVLLWFLKREVDPGSEWEATLSFGEETAFKDHGKVITEDELAEWLSQEPETPVSSPNGSGTPAIDVISTALRFPLTMQPAPGAVTEGTISQRLRRELRAALGPIAERPTHSQLKHLLRERTSTEVVNGTLLTQWREIPAGLAAASAGDLAGGQAALVSFTSALRDAVVPIVQTIEPLVPAYDQERLDARRQVIIDLVTAAPETLAAPGGYSTWQVEALHSQLDGQVKAWGRVLGVVDKDGELDYGRVQTPAEDVAMSQYQIVDRWVQVLQIQLREADEIGPKDLGSGFYNLERALQVVAADVETVRSACAIVGVGPEERAGTRIAVNDRSIVLERLLAWIDDDATARFPALLDGSGRLALDLIADTLQRQSAAVSALITANTDPSTALGYPMVQQAFADLSRHLDDAQTIATELQ